MRARPGSRGVRPAWLLPILDSDPAQAWPHEGNPLDCQLIAGLFQKMHDAAAFPGSRVIEGWAITPGPDPFVFAYVKATMQQAVWAGSADIQLSPAFRGMRRRHRHLRISR